MNHNQLHRLKRTGTAATIAIAGVAGLALLRNESGGGDHSQKPAPIRLFKNPGSKAVDNKQGELLHIEIKPGALAPASEAAETIAKAEGQRVGSVAVDAAIVEGQRLLTEDLTGSPDDDEFIQGGQSVDVIASHKIVDPAAFNNYPHDLKITKEG